MADGNRQLACGNEFRVSNGAIRTACVHLLPEHGAAELHVAAASEETEAYGIFITGQTLSICRKANQIRLLDADGATRWKMALPEGFRHDALHCLTLRWDKTVPCIWTICCCTA